MRTALRMWFLLDRPQYGDQGDFEFFGQSDAVYYERQCRAVIREINAPRNFHKASRVDGDAYRPRLRGSTFPIEESADKTVCRAREFDMLIEELAKSSRCNTVCSLLRPAGSKRLVRISYEEEKRMKASREWLRVWAGWVGVRWVCVWWRWGPEKAGRGG